jgi:hypothetical protein
VILRSVKPKHQTEQTLRKVADNIIRTTTFTFVNNKTGEKFESTKGKDTTNSVRAESKFNKWQYVTEYLLLACCDWLMCYTTINIPTIPGKISISFSTISTISKKCLMPAITALNIVPFSESARSMIVVPCRQGCWIYYQFDKRKDYLDYLNRVGDYIINKQVKFPDGTLARNGPRRMTLWADDLYMSVPYLARMGKLTGDKKYFDFAIQQVEQFNKYIYDSTTGLYFHSFYNDQNHNGVARWGRL